MYEKNQDFWRWSSTRFTILCLNDPSSLCIAHKYTYSTYLAIIRGRGNNNLYFVLLCTVLCVCAFKLYYHMINERERFHKQLNNIQKLCIFIGSHVRAYNRSYRAQHL